MRWFETRGPVNPQDNYVVPRTDELADFIQKVKKGRYIVLFAPRQTGKTTFFRAALDALEAETFDWFPIQLNFEEYKNVAPDAFYGYLSNDILTEIQQVFQRRKQGEPSEALKHFLANLRLTEHVSMRMFFEELGRFLPDRRVVLIIDEFDGIPPATVSDFLHSLRRIYLSPHNRCIHSVGIVGVKSIAQLNYDRSVSPFNVQDEFHLPNFTFKQVQELLAQYTEEAGQAFTPDVVENLHRQTDGQPVLVNRLAQILTEELDIPKDETLGREHFLTAHAQILGEPNVNIQHLTTHIRSNPNFQRVLMRITSYDAGLDFNIDDEVISELATYGIIKKGSSISNRDKCEITNPIYLYRILKTLKPTINGLEEEYYPHETDNAHRTSPIEYINPAGHIDMAGLLDNFRDFIARAGYRILQVPDTPQEFVGQYLLFAYLDQFVQQVNAVMHLEVQTGRGRIDLMVSHRGQKHIVETKMWQGEKSCQAGKEQLARYLKLEGAPVGYYVVFDYRQTPKPQVKTEQIAGMTIRSYVIPVVQEQPSAITL